MTAGSMMGSRRAWLVAALGATLGAAASIRGGPVAAQTGATEIFFVSRDRILREAVAARRLRDAEETMTADLQGQIDATKLQFAAEEEELTRLRGELPVAEFESRVAEFDQRVRQARRVAQERAALLQKSFQDARAVIVAALPSLMERLRVEAGARMIVNADQVLAAAVSADLTDRAIKLFDADGPSPAVPEIDFSAPLAEPQPGTMPPPVKPPG
jgi:Skp family chaperone for outer membrane proteins